MSVTLGRWKDEHVGFCVMKRCLVKFRKNFASSSIRTRYIVIRSRERETLGHANASNVGLKKLLQLSLFHTGRGRIGDNPNMKTVQILFSFVYRTKFIITVYSMH